MMTVHPIYRVRAFQLVAPYTLRVQFDDETQQVIDFEPILAGERFRPLRADFDPQRFTTGRNMLRLLRHARQWELTPA